jgi:hypothetical protein
MTATEEYWEDVYRAHAARLVRRFGWERIKSTLCARDWIAPMHDTPENARYIERYEHANRIWKSLVSRRAVHS